MQSGSSLFLHVIVPAFLALFLFTGNEGSLTPTSNKAFQFDIHHRFSDKVRRWAESRAWSVGEWPKIGTVEYYVALVEHDRVLRLEGRRLEGSDPSGVTFSRGNTTVRINKLGFLHYAEVSIGTPSVSFLVALDTGSDLFWVPCDCMSCAATSAQSYGVNFELNVYSTNSSLTSKKVPCNTSLCEFQKACSGPSGICPYKVAYISSDTASSGFLVEDVLYLTTEDARQEAVEARVTFGCGQVQTGSFLDSAAPNGLFGLGMKKISVPSILANAGLISNSFSMCFGHDGIGRISFGDKGSSDQEETSFDFDHLHPTYIVRVTGMQVGESSFAEDLLSLIDSGTSFTTLANPTYRSLSESFNSQVHDKRHSPDPQIPFEYCYLISSNQTEIPSVSLIMGGGSKFPVTNPIIFISTPTEVVYCLAIVKSNDLNIIGQNFMSGLRVVFDRERLVLGWKKFDCYDTEDVNPLPVTPRNSSALLPPSVMGPDNYNPEATKQGGNPKQISIVQPSACRPLYSDPSIFLYSSVFLLSAIIFLTILF